MKLLKIALGSLLVGVLSTASAYHTPEHAQELEETRELTSAIADYVVDRLYNYNAPELPADTKDCVSMATDKILEYTYDYIKKYCGRAKKSIGKKMCLAASLNSKFIAGTYLYEMKPVNIAAAYCAGHLNLSKSIAMNRTIFNETNFFNALNEERAAIYTNEMDLSESPEMQKLRSYTNCKTCVTETKLDGIEYLYEKWVGICAENFALGKEHENKLIDFFCGLMSYDPEVAKGMLFTKYTVVNFASGFCLGTGACNKKGDDTLDMEAFFRAYTAKKAPAQQLKQQNRQ